VDTLPIGTLHVGVPFDPDWHLTVDGTGVAGRRAFGSTLGFDNLAAGTGTLSYDTGFLRPLWVAVQFLLLVALLLAASRVRSTNLVPRRRLVVLDDPTPVVDLTSPFPPPVLTPVDDPDALHFIEDDPS
jgi:hypothetical protein